MMLMQLVKAQTTPMRINASNNNAWLMYTGSHRISEKTGLHLEIQWRRNDIFRNPQQLLFRTGFNYHLTPQVTLTAGYCFVETYPYGDQPVRSTFPENRFWEQLQVRTQMQKTEWVARFRLEQRLSRLPVQQQSAYEPGEAVYTNRARLMNRISVPLRGMSIRDGSFYATMYDEVMVNFGERVGVNIFDQNRLYAALGYRIPKAGRLELGYLYQTIIKSDGIRIENNHTLQVGLFSSLDFFRQQ